MAAQPAEREDNIITEDLRGKQRSKACCWRLSLLKINKTILSEDAVKVMYDYSSSILVLAQKESYTKLYLLRYSFICSLLFVLQVQ